MEKDKIVDWLHQQIDEASGKIDGLKLQTHLGKAELKDSFDERIDSLESQKDNLRNKTQHLQQSTSSAWEDLGEGCKNSWLELKSAIQKAVDDLKS
ncbi:MAG: hypothetical protein P1V20_03460 [Verrucomicrobiales bacterium]|nr:hypothetical protein [Verrucomicrobiales bacterium]